jgi:ribonuclease BN (tRNA processing enzyme)
LKQEERRERSTPHGQRELTVLGSGGWIPTSRRETCSAMIREGPHVLVIDAGSGIRHLVEQPVLLGGADTLDIILTHFHLDHVIGLSYLPAIALARPPRIFGAGERLNGVPTRTILERLLGPPLFSAPLDAITSAVQELKSTENEIGPFTVETRVQKLHSEPTLALRIGSLTYCTDTASDPGNVAFASGSTVLLHEAWYPQDSSSDRNHSGGGDAGRIARAAAVQQLVLIHVSPLLGSDEELLASAVAEFGNTVVGTDLLTIPLD